MSAITGALETFKVIDTADPDYYFSLLRSFRPNLKGFSASVTPDGWNARINVINCGDVRIAATEADEYRFSGTSDSAFFSTMLRGHVELNSRNRSTSPSPGAVMPHIHDHVSLRVGAGYKGISLSCSDETLAGAIGAFLPENPARAIRAIETDPGRYDFSAYQRNIVNFHELLRTTEHMLLNEARYRREAGDTLLLSLAQALAGGMSDGPTPGAWRYFGRAIDFIEVYFAEEIRIATIADAAGCSIRLLQDLFRVIEGRTITQYITARRLAHARMLLLEIDGVHSVTSAALDSGFSHFGLFARQYRAAFAELPSATLRAMRAPRRR
jgi:AraC-like DNA-binding protein